MNARLAAKRALLASGRFPRPVPAVGLFDATGSIALAVGAFRPRVLIDPRAYGEDRTLKVFALWHESAHVICGHLLLLFVFRWLGIVFMAGVFASAAVVSGSLVATCVAGAVGAWCEARVGIFTLYVREKAETEADALALSVMQPHAFASAVKTMASVTKPRRGIDGWVDCVVYGRTWRERVARQGIVCSEIES